MNYTTRTHYAEKYKDYVRVNTFKGWAKHIYLVLISLIVNPNF